MGVVELKEVTATFVREVDHINYLTILDEFGNEQVIATTDSHPFWVVTDEPDLERAARGTVDENGVILYHENIDPGLHGFWVEAKDLREGDVFLGANGELLTLVSQERVEFEESITVYNFTVDGNHNYFVIAETDEYGQTCVLVHNADPWYKQLWFWFKSTVTYVIPDKKVGGAVGIGVTLLDPPAARALPGFGANPRMIDAMADGDFDRAHEIRERLRSGIPNPTFD